MSDDTRVQAGPWPLGPFVDFPDPEGEDDEQEPTPAKKAETASADDADKAAPAPSQPTKDSGWKGAPTNKLPPSHTPTKAADPEPDHAIPEDDDEDPEPVTDAEPSSPWPFRPRKGKTLDPPITPRDEYAEPIPVDKTDTAYDEREAVHSAVRFARLVNLATRLADRRILGAKYSCAAALGWHFGWLDRARQALENAHYHPTTGATAAIMFASCATAWRMRKNGSRRGFLLVGAGGVFGSGLIAPTLVGYAMEKGVDVSTAVPQAIGLSTTLTLWWLIDLRTERWAVHFPGRVLHWASCSLTATAALATALYMTP